jgi:hypothetical protein
VLTVAIVLRPDFGSVFARALQRGISAMVGAVLGDHPLRHPGGRCAGFPAPFAGLLPYGPGHNSLFSTFLAPPVSS